MLRIFGQARLAALTIVLSAACVVLLLLTIASASSAQTSASLVETASATSGARAETAQGAIHKRTLPPAWIAFTRAWTTIEGYSAKVTVFERKGAQVQNMVCDYTFRKPSNAIVRIIQGPNAGVTLVWNGGTTLVAHRGSGLMSMFKKTLSLHDPAAMTIRGSSIDQLSFGAILTQARQTLGTVSQRPGEVINGVATDSVRLIATASVKNTGLTLQVVEISKTTHFPMRVLGYEDQALVRRIDFSNVKLEPNPRSTPSVLSLPSPMGTQSAAEFIDLP